MKTNHLLKRCFMTIYCPLALFIALASHQSKAECDEVYLKIGSGYKFEEQREIRLNHDNNQVYLIKSSPYSARFEAALDCGNITIGLSHHSQWATGAPFNDTGEYYKTEFFIDYKFSWGIK